MKLYRVATFNELDVNESTGFRWFRSRTQAALWVRSLEVPHGEVEEIVTGTKKDDLVDLLNHYADYPDNG